MNYLEAVKSFGIVIAVLVGISALLLFLAFAPLWLIGVAFGALITGVATVFVYQVRTGAL